MKTVYAIQNDTVDAICWRNYGRSSGVVEAVLEANPHLSEQHDTNDINITGIVHDDQIQCV